MKKRFRIFAVLCLLSALLMLPAFAAEADEQLDERLYGELGATEVEAALPAEAEEVLGDLPVMDSLDVDAGMGKIKEAVLGSAGGILKSGLKSAALILVVVMLCSVAGAIYDGGSVPDFVPLGGALAIAAVAAGDVSSFIGLGTQTLQTLSDFSKVLLPSLATASAASGAITAATAKYVATALFMDVLLTLSLNLIVPIIYAYLAAVLANAAAGGEALKACANLLKTICTLLLTALVIAFTAYLSITGVISGSADAATTRLAKTTISTMLPVVGSIISDAAGTLVAGAAIVRNAVGVFGLLAVIGICLAPVLTLGAHYLLYKVAAALAGTMSDSRLGGLIGGIGGAFGMVLATVGAGAIFMFISIISSIRAVTGT